METKSQDIFFDKNKSNYIKGFAIVLMIIHHLFAFENRIENVEYISIIPNLYPTIESRIGIFSRICVPIYLFISGYGLYYSYKNKDNVEYKSILNRIWNLLKVYWIILIIFLIIGLVTNKRVFNFNEFINNMLTLSASYNGEWWFLNTYIIMLLLFPIIKKIIDTSSKNKLFFIPILTLSLEIICGKLLSYEAIYSTRILKLVLQAMAYQLPFIMGCIIAKLDIFNIFYKIFNKTIYNNIFIHIGIITIYFFIREMTTIMDFIMVPIIIYSLSIIIEKLKLDVIFTYLGKHSTNLWLIHSFFCYYYFQQLIFKPKFSLFILIWIIIICLITSNLINIIYNKLYKKDIALKEYLKG